MRQNSSGQPEIPQWMLHKKQLYVMITVHKKTAQDPLVKLVPLDQHTLDRLDLDTRYSAPLVPTPYWEDPYVIDSTPQNPPTGSYLSIQDLFNLHADKVIIRATEFETYPDFDDATVAIPMTEPEPDLKWNIARNFVVGAVAVVVVVGFIATLPISGPIAAAATVGACVLGGAVVISSCLQDAKSGQARDPIEMFNQTFFGAVTGAVSGAFGGASGAMLGSVTAKIGLIVLGNAYSAAGETIIENTMFGEDITMKELLENAALGALTGGVGDNLHRAGNRAGKKLIGEGAEKAGRAGIKGGRQYDKYVRAATRKPARRKVVLGKFNQDGVSYVDVAKKENATYFQLEDWDKVTKTVGEENMWKINEQFLQEQLSQGKTFILSHNPGTATGYFAEEVNFLKRHGYSFIQEGTIWKAVR